MIKRPKAAYLLTTGVYITSTDLLEEDTVVVVTTKLPSPDQHLPPPPPPPPGGNTTSNTEAGTGTRVAHEATKRKGGKVVSSFNLCNMGIVVLTLTLMALSHPIS